MALAVDTTGRVKASPVTGKPLKGTIADAVDEALKEDLERTDEEQPGVSPGAANVSVIGSKLKAYQPTYGGMPYSQPAPQQASGMGISDQTWMPGPSNDEDLSEAARLDIEWPVKPEEVESGYWSPGPQRESSRQDGRTVSPDVLDHTGTTEQWELDAAAREGREARTSNYWGEDYARSASQFDQGLDYIGNTPTNDAYIRHFIETGDLTEDEAYDIMHNGPSFLDHLAETFGIPWLNSVAATVAAGRHARDREEPGPIDVPQIGGSELLGDVWTTIDDGTSYDYDHMTAELMTGTQYMKYSEMGMGGRPIEDIDPTGVYSKRRESVNYGFVPFTPDSAAYTNLIVGNMADLPAEIGANVAGLRDAVTPDYTISYGGEWVDKDKDRSDLPWWQQISQAAASGRPGRHSPEREYVGGTTINGVDFDRRYPTYLNQLEYNMKFHPEMFLMDPGDSPATAYVKENAFVDANGNQAYAYGNIADVGYDENLYLVFDDGTVAIPPEEYNTWESGPDGLQIPSWYEDEYGQYLYPDDSVDRMYTLTFSDGQTFELPESSIESMTVSLVSADRANGQLPEDLGTLNDVDSIMDSIEQNGGNISDYAGFYYLPDMVMPDGTHIRWEDVDRIRSDADASDAIQNPLDDDLNYGFMPLDLNKPARMTAQQPFRTVEIENPDGTIDRRMTFDGSDTLLNAIDWTAGSLPISLNLPFWNPWVYAASNGLTGLSGTNPQSWDPATDSYTLTAGDYDANGNLRYGITDQDGNWYDDRSDRLRGVNSALNAAVPLTENIAGDIGSDPVKRLLTAANILRPLGDAPGLPRLLTHALVDMAGEGIEEIIGNVFDEATMYGEDMYSMPVMVENSYGELVPLRDVTGREIRDFDTPWLSTTPWDEQRKSGSPIGDRWENISSQGDDFLNAFYGGALVDAVMNLIGLSPEGSIVPRIGNAWNVSQARRNTGVAPFVEPVVDVGSEDDSERLTLRELVDRLLDRYPEDSEADDLSPSVEIK